MNIHMFSIDMTLNHETRALSDLKGNGEFSSIKQAPALDHTVPDELHLILRVTDVLIKAHIETASTL